MPPNLALLVNEISDTSIIAITPMLYTKLHDKNWEIRDSALEILNTVVEIAHLSRFTIIPITTQIMHYNK